MKLNERERAVLEALQKLPTENAVLVGGYAVNAYVPPRFSIDCDLVVLGSPAALEGALTKGGFVRAHSGDVPYGSYVRYVRKKEGISFDLLIDAVQDRDSQVVFERRFFEAYSHKRTTVGRVNPIRLELRIADPELLFAMKFVAGRRQDVRDLFMLAGESLDWTVVRKILKEKCTPALIAKRAETIRTIVNGDHYRASLQGAFGALPDERFESCKERLLAVMDNLQS